MIFLQSEGGKFSGFISCLGALLCNHCIVTSLFLLSWWQRKHRDSTWFPFASLQVLVP